MTLPGLLALQTQRAEFRRLVEQLRKGEGLPTLTGITQAARPFVIAALATGVKQPLLVVVEDETQANQIVESLKVFVEQADDVLYLPDRDALPYERLISDALTAQQRMWAMIALAEQERNVIVVCSARVLTQPVMPAQELSATLYTLQVGQEVDLTLMLEHLYNLGYEPVAEVEEPGQFSHRGGIVDLFPPTLPRPVRVEFLAMKLSHYGRSTRRRSDHSIQLPHVSFARPAKHCPCADLKQSRNWNNSIARCCIASARNVGNVT